MLHNLNLQTTKPDEVVIVDASETDETRLTVESNLHKLAYPVNYYSHEKGLTRQRNFGIKKARHDIVGFSDDDAIFEPDYLKRILSIFEEDGRKEIGGVSGFIYQIEGCRIPGIDHNLKTVNDGRDFSRIMEPLRKGAININRSRWKKRMERLVLLQRRSDREGTYCPFRGKLYGIYTPFTGIREADFLSGIAFYRGEVFQRERYSEYFEHYGFGEDAHLSLKVHRFARLVVDGEASAYHLHAPAGRPNLYVIGQMSARNRFYTFRTFNTRGPLVGLVFWAYFWVEAFLDFLPAFFGRSTHDRAKLLFGRMVGSLSTMREAFAEVKNKTKSRRPKNL